MHVFQAELTWVQPVLFFCAKGMRSGFTLFGRNLCNVRAQKSRRYSVPIRSQATTRSHEEYLGGWRFTYSIARRGSCRSLVLPELPLRAGGVWRPIRPVPNVQSVSRKRNFALSPTGFRPMVALSINAIQGGCGRQRTRLGGTTSQAPGRCCHSTEHPLGRTKTPEASALSAIGS
jgi:hypothetical protein